MAYLEIFFDLLRKHVNDFFFVHIFLDIFGHIEQYFQLRKWSIMNGIEVKIPEADLPCENFFYLLSFDKGFLVFIQAQ
jgi:hypothetical protein